MHGSTITSMHACLGIKKHINYIIIVLDSLLNEGTVTGSEAMLTVKIWTIIVFTSLQLLWPLLLLNMGTLFSISANLNNNL